MTRPSLSGLWGRGTSLPKRSAGLRQNQPLDQYTIVARRFAIRGLLLFSNRGQNYVIITWSKMHNDVIWPIRFVSVDRKFMINETVRFCYLLICCLGMHPLRWFNFAFKWHPFYRNCIFCYFCRLVCLCSSNFRSLQNLSNSNKRCHLTRMTRLKVNFKAVLCVLDKQFANWRLKLVLCISFYYSPHLLHVLVNK